MAEMRLYNGRLLPKVPPDWTVEINSFSWSHWRYIFLMRMPSEEREDGWLYRAIYACEVEYDGFYLSGGTSFYFDSGGVVFELSGSGEWMKMGTISKYFNTHGFGKTFDIRYFFWSNIGLNHKSRKYEYFPRPGISSSLKEELPVAPADPTAKLQGWIVGKRLAAMRGKEPQVNTGAWLGLATLGRMILGKE